jgi:hypothetical protein
MSKYRIVHTGPKIHGGGLKNGLFRVVYQVFTELIVKIEPIKPAPSHTIIAKSNLRYLFTINSMSWP